MPFINQGLLIQLLRQNRILWLKGRFGGGKSSLSYAIAYELYRQKAIRYVVSNIPCVFADHPADIELRDGKFMDTVVVMDEAGLFMRYGRDTQEFLIGLRKLNVFFILPSIEKPASRVRSLNVQRVFNAQVLGLPLWIYKVHLSNDDERESDWFAWWKPSEIWGVYDTEAIPLSDGGIGKSLRRFLASVCVDTDRDTERETTEREDALNQLMDESGGEADAFLEATEEFTNVIPLLGDAIKQSRRRR